MSVLTITGMRTSRGQNSREHYMVRSRRVKNEREQVAWVLKLRPPIRPILPAVVTITRVAPSNGLDDDNLSGAMKAVRDQIAEWLGVDDKHKHIVRYEYDQRRGPWAVEISWRKAWRATHESIESVGRMSRYTINGDEMAKQNTRIYTVRSKTDNEIVALVDATSQAAARQHIASKQFQIDLSSQSDLISATKAGLDVEVAKVSSDQQQPVLGE